MAVLLRLRWLFIGLFTLALLSPLVLLRVLSAAPPPAPPAQPAPPTPITPPWLDAAGRYRIPVQVYNKEDKLRTDVVLAFTDLPFLTWISEQKLAADGRDLRLVDDKGKAAPLRAERLTSDSGDARLCFVVDEIKAKARRQFWLYFGGATLQAAALEEGAMPEPQPEIVISAGAEETRLPLPAVSDKALAQWLLTHRLYEAEAGTATGFAAQQPGGNLAQLVSGKVMVAANGPQDTLTLEVDLDGGESTVWVRCSPGLPGVPQQGTLTATVARKTAVLAKQTIDVKPKTAPTEAEKDNPKFRWLPLRVTAAQGKAQVTVTAAGSRLAVDCVVVTKDAAYRPDFRDFQGNVWVRWRIDKPAEYRYWTKVHNEINPYAPKYELTGSVNAFGLLPGVERLPFLEETDLFRAGQYSPWVLLPTSKAAQWHSVLFFQPKQGNAPDDLTVRLEFANRPTPRHVFHVTPAEPVEAGPAALAVRMPTVATLEGLSQLETFTEWAIRRAQIVEKLKLSPPPRLQKLQIGTWDFLATRLGGGKVSKARADIDLRALEAIGVNALTSTGISDELLAEFAKTRGLISTTWTVWAGMWYYTREGYDGVYNYRDGETPQQHWARVFGDYYAKTVANHKKNSPFATSFAKHINLGDEIGAATNVDGIVKTPQILAYFREWLRGQGLTPADLGADAWDQVLPVDDRKKLNDGNDLAYARLFYWSRRFMTHYTVIFYQAATGEVKKHFPKAEMIAVNYQAGPMQIGFIGNNNDMDRGMLDIFELSHERAFEGVMLEDWVSGWDMGIGRICLGAEMMRAAGRKHNLPLASYLVGGEAIRAKYFAYLMHGVKENQFYLYGPITNIGPAWAESEKALAETAEISRMVKKFEDPIYAGVVRPRKAAMLVAGTADIMQKKGLYFCAERQNTYIMLKHDYLPVDVVYEQEVIGDDVLKHYSLLYVTDPQMRVATQRKIADWVKDGGKLWACVGAANWDEYNQPCGVLNDVFGVAKREMVTQDGWIKWASASYGWQPKKFAYTQVDTLTGSGEFAGVELPVWGARLDCTPTTAQTVGAYADGKPAVLVNTYGKGQAMLVGALLGEAYIRQHYPDNVPVGKEGWAFDLGAALQPLLTAQAKAAGVSRPVTLSIPGIYTSVMDSPQGSIVFLNNASLASETKMENALKPTVTVRVQATGVKTVESSKLGPLKFEAKGGEVIFTLPLPNADVILLRR